MITENYIKLPSDYENSNRAGTRGKIYVLNLNNILCNSPGMISSAQSASV